MRILPTKKQKAKICIDYSLGQEHLITLKAVTYLGMQIEDLAFSDISISILPLQPENAKTSQTM